MSWKRYLLIVVPIILILTGASLFCSLVALHSSLTFFGRVLFTCSQLAFFIGGVILGSLLRKTKENRHGKES